MSARRDFERLRSLGYHVILQDNEGNIIDSSSQPRQPMIDRSRCMARRDGSALFSGEFCQETATHTSPLGRRCERHAEVLKGALRDPNTLLNVLARRGPLTDEQIEKVVVRLSS